MVRFLPIRQGAIVVARIRPFLHAQKPQSDNFALISYSKTPETFPGCQASCPFATLMQQISGPISVACFMRSISAFDGERLNDWGMRQLSANQLLDV
jgi:hypothetical protein